MRRAILLALIVAIVVAGGAVAVAFVALASVSALVMWLAGDRPRRLPVKRTYGSPGEWVSDGGFCVYCSAPCTDPKVHGHLVFVQRAPLPPSH